jgi:uncharacterized protein YndB with AHSA1/START domain
MASNQNSFVKDFANGKIVVKHFCDADLDTVWDMWTKPELLDIWWAPKPWKSETKSMSFKNGGRRLYAMVGPGGERHWAFGDFSSINPKTGFDVKDGFADEKGNVNTQMPQTDWKLVFDKSGSGVLVTISLIGNGPQLQKLVEMGFEEGFKMALGNLDEEIKKKISK